MKNKRTIFNSFHIGSAIFLVATLLWLTVSTPFVFASQQYQIEQNKLAQSHHDAPPSDEEETSNPFGNTTEEKTPSTSSLTEEYLHDHHTMDYFGSAEANYPASEDADTYIAFHGELLVPPPNAA